MQVTADYQLQHITVCGFLYMWLIKGFCFFLLYFQSAVALHTDQTRVKLVTVDLVMVEVSMLELWLHFHVSLAILGLAPAQGLVSHQEIGMDKIHHVQNQVECLFVILSRR